MARSVRRRSAPLSPAKSRAKTASPRQTRNSKRTLSREPEPRETRQKPQPHLEPVDEDEDTITVNTSGRINEAIANTNIVQNETFESADHSGDESESDDLSDLDRDDILESLDDIERNAQNLLEIFHSGSVFDVIHTLKDASSKKAQRFQKILGRLGSDLEPCGRGFMIFCPIFRIKQVFNERGLPSGLAAVFYKANTAILVSKLAEIGEDEHATRSELLQVLNTANGFPNLFFDFNNEPGLIDDEFCVQTADKAISLLIQYYIDVMGNTVDDQQIEAGDLLSKIFLDEGMQPKFLVCGNGSIQTRKAIDAMMLETISEMVKFVHGKPRSKRNLSTLRTKYSWASMVEELVDWVKDAHARLDERITAGGGVRKMISDLKQDSMLEIPDSIPEDGEDLTISQQEKRAFRENVSYLQAIDEELDALQQDNDGSESEADINAEGPTQGAVTVPRVGDQSPAGNIKGILSSRAAVAKRRETFTPVRQLSEQVEGPPRSLTPQVHPEEEALEVHNAHPGIDEDEEVLGPEEPPQMPGIRPTQETLGVMNLLRQQESNTSDKENRPANRRFRLHERQPDATRVEFDDESQRTPKRPTKRTRGQMTEDDDDDDGDFERDTRQHKHARPHRGKEVARAATEFAGTDLFIRDSEEPDEPVGAPRPAQRQVLSEIRTGFTQPEASGQRSRGRDTATVDRSATNSPDSDRRSTAASRQPPPSSAADAYAGVRQDAARNIQRAALVTAAQHPIKQPQTRRAWEYEEIEALLFYMEKFGPVWARIKEADSESRSPRLEDRTQVQLKDKARNMKLDFLKAEKTLPWYLENVTINQRHKEDLRKRGIVIP